MGGFHEARLAQLMDRCPGLSVGTLSDLPWSLLPMLNLEGSSERLQPATTCGWSFNADFMTDASDPSQFTPSSPSCKIEDSSLTAGTASLIFTTYALRLLPKHGLALAPLHTLVSDPFLSDEEGCPFRRIRASAMCGEGQHVANHDHLNSF